MEHLFITVLNMSITGSYVILVILLFRLLLRNAPKKYAYLLWLAAAFRLVCPASFISGWSFLHLRGFDMSKAQQTGVHILSYVPQEIGMAANPEISIGLPAVNRLINDSLPAATPYYSANPMQIWLFIFACIWIIGMAVLAVYAVGSYTMVSLRMRTAVRLENGVYCSERVQSPFVLGCIRPRIYLPYGLSEEAKVYVLTHERYHLKRFDHLIKLLAFCIAVLHWFNPLVWVALVLFGNDQEMRTDEAVLSEIGVDIRKAYSTVLLGFAANHRYTIPKPLAFGENGVKTRIRNTLRWKTPKKATSVVCLCLTAAVLIACAANPPSRAVHAEALVSGTYYVADEHLYSASGDDQSETDFIYKIDENQVISYDLQKKEVLLMSGGLKQLTWAGQEQSYQALMRLYEKTGIEPIKRDYRNLSICPVGEHNAIARVADELWIILAEKNDLTDIYRLEKTDRLPESYGFNYLEWAFNPVLSSQLPALRFGCDLRYKSITASCENGTMIGFDSPDLENGYPSGKTLTVPAGKAVYWAPTGTQYLAVSEDTVTITVELYSGETLTGTVSVEGSRFLPDEPGDRYKYFARFSSDDLYLCPDYENGGGVMLPIQKEFSPLDHPLVD